MKYRVTFEYRRTVEVEVEAENEQDAIFEARSDADDIAVADIDCHCVSKTAQEIE